MPYIPFTDEQKITANSIELADFLRMRGEKLERAGREYKLIYYDSSGKHDSITMSGSRWFDHKNQVGGGPIKFMQYHYGISFPESVQALLGYTVLPQRSPPKQEKAEEKREFILPEVNADMHRVYAYLIKQRFIAPEIITHFAKQKTLYEDKVHHNAVFVGLDENGIPRQAHKRSTSTFGKSFRQTIEGSDTKYSFVHFGNSEKLFVFEAPIDMLSFLTLYPQDWQEHSYIAMNGVYENAVLTALKGHSNLSEIVICTDNDEGGIDAADRLRDILREQGYTKIYRSVPNNKDWNEDLKMLNGTEALPAVPHSRKREYNCRIENLQKLRCSPNNLPSRINAAYKSRQYDFLAETALAGSVFFLQKSGCSAGFESLCAKLKGEYRAYTDKGGTAQKTRCLSEKMREVMQELGKSAQTREESVLTAKLLYQLADHAVRICVDESMSAAEQCEKIEEELEPEMVFG